jgi:hypothetical protein
VPDNLSLTALVADDPWHPKNVCFSVFKHYSMRRVAGAKAQRAPEPKPALPGHACGFAPATRPRFLEKSDSIR